MLLDAALVDPGHRAGDHSRPARHDVVPDAIAHARAVSRLGAVPAAREERYYR